MYPLNTKQSNPKIKPTTKLCSVMLRNYCYDRKVIYLNLVVIHLDKQYNILIANFMLNGQHLFKRTRY